MSPLLGRCSLLALSLLAGASCRLSPGGRPGAGEGDAAVPVSSAPALSAGVQRELAKKLEDARKLTDERLLQGHPSPFLAKLSYNPLEAKGLDLIKKSSLAPSDAEEVTLKERGFVISERLKVPHFTYGYSTIYGAHLPLYISADSILQAVHQGFDDSLMIAEDGALHADIGELLRSLRERLAVTFPAGVSAETRADLDLFLSVGLSLLDGKPAAPIAGADPVRIAKLVSQAKQATGTAKESLFGSVRELDFSQFKPRGHYAGNPDRENYFRALIWFGRTEIQLSDPTPGAPFPRRQVEAALVLGELANAEILGRFGRIDQAIGAFVGENESLTLAGVADLKKALGVADLAALKAVDDETLTARIRASKLGTQRIVSQILEGGEDKARELPQVFQLLGQRYTVDSHALSSVVFDRTRAHRMMPSPLDAAFAALGNDQAAKLLAPELAKYQYAPQLEATRLLIDAHEPAYWDGSLYTLWLSSLRALSPVAAEVQNPKGVGLPEVAGTEAWGRRLLSTQLASWSELRHNTVLYAKESYSSMVSCEFPDAYVDPYPAFYARLGRYALRGEAVTRQLHNAYPSSMQIHAAATHFTKLKTVLHLLEGMAVNQRAGKAFTAEQMAFVNQTVSLTLGCAGPMGAEGWYPDLFTESGKALEFKPTITGVHTQSTDENGATVGKVLHVGTGYARRIIVTADTCHGPRAYVGFVSSYFEKVTENFSRLTDAEWADSIRDKHPADPAWLGDLISR